LRQPGVEPGISRPQREVLTTILLTHPDFEVRVSFEGRTTALSMTANSRFLNNVSPRCPVQAVRPQQALALKTTRHVIEMALAARRNTS
jgi:hypothetical protein